MIDKTRSHNIPVINYKDSMKIVLVMMGVSVFLPYILVGLGITSPFIYAVLGALIVGMTPLSIYKQLNKSNRERIIYIRCLISIVCFLSLYFAAYYHIIY